jgi:hypothetical protein
LINHNFCSQKTLKELNDYWGGGGDEDDAVMTVMLVFLQKQLLVTVGAGNNYLYLEIVQKKPKHISREPDKLTYIVDFVARSQYSSFFLFIHITNQK